MWNNNLLLQCFYSWLQGQMAAPQFEESEWGCHISENRFAIALCIGMMAPNLATSLKIRHQEAEPPTNCFYILFAYKLKSIKQTRYNMFKGSCISLYTSESVYRSWEELLHVRCCIKPF